MCRGVEDLEPAELTWLNGALNSSSSGNGGLVADDFLMRKCFGDFYKAG
jgi:hypothetical protein